MLSKIHAYLWLALVVGLLTVSCTAHAANIDLAMPVVLQHEGGYSSDRNDPGNWTGGKVGQGKLVGTKYGIAANTYPNLDIKNLTVQQATALYKRDYWDKLRLDEVKSQAIATIVFDCAINMGSKTEARIVQTAVNLTNYPKVAIPVDGVIGDVTLAFVNQQRTPVQRRVLYIALCGLQFERYHSIANRNPKMLRYMRSWLNRVGRYE